MSLISVIKRALRYIIKGTPNGTNITTAQVSYLSPNQRLAGKKIIITGGGRGLGFAMAKKFVEEGANVLIAGRNEETLIKSASEIGCKYLQLDVQNIKGFKDFIIKANNLLGGVNCLVNNAGISLHENGFLDVTSEQWDAQFDTNLKGPFFLTQEFIRSCQTSESKEMRNVLFVSSETSVTVDERPYGLTKAAMNSLVQGLAYRYVTKGFRINAIAPGVTTSDMTGARADGNLTCTYNVTKRFYLPEEIAEIACFLLSDSSNILNGEILVANEGKTINARWK